MRILFSSMVAATILVAGGIGWKAEAAMMTGAAVLPLQTESYTPVETVAYRHYRRAYRRGYRRGYYGYGWRPGFSIYIGPGWGWGY
jgi:hypothetical protein